MDVTSNPCHHKHMAMLTQTVDNIRRCAHVLPDSTDNQGAPIKIANSSAGLAFEGDKFRPVLDAIDASVKDTQGRSWPGNSLNSSNEMQPRCWNTEEVHLIRITDSCPCTQVGFKPTSPE